MKSLGALGGVPPGMSRTCLLFPTLMSSFAERPQQNLDPPLAHGHIRSLFAGVLRNLSTRARVFLPSTPSPPPSPAPAHADLAVVLTSATCLCRRQCLKPIQALPIALVHTVNQLLNRLHARNLSRGLNLRAAPVHGRLVPRRHLTQRLVHSLTHRQAQPQLR